MNLYEFDLYYRVLAERTMRELGITNYYLVIAKKVCM